MQPAAAGSGGGAAAAAAAQARMQMPGAAAAQERAAFFNATAQQRRAAALLTPLSLHPSSLSLRGLASRGATFGCLHGPCTAVYHFPCARALAFKGQLIFSLQSRDMACPKHIKL
jgi:hypothetical protein